MSSKFTIVVNTNDNANDILALVPIATTSPQTYLERIWKYFLRIQNGSSWASVVVTNNGVSATGTGTFTGAATANQTMTIAGVTFTAKASPNESSNQYLVSATVALEAASLARAINASTGCAGVVTATSALGVVTITSVVPGIVGNFITTDDVDTSNFTFAQAVLAGGTQGTTGTMHAGL